MIRRLLGIRTSKYKRMTVDEALAQLDGRPPDGILYANHHLSDEELERLERDYSPCDPVWVDGDSIMVRAQLMETGRFYCVSLGGKPYIYRKLSASEIEVYGLADPT